MRQLQWMMFVDGENLTIRAQEHLAAHLAPGPFYRRDSHVWFPYATQRYLPTQLRDEARLDLDLETVANRWHYYTSTKGSERDLEDVSGEIWSMGFTPAVFKKDGNGRSKGVDITLATDMLSGAFMGTYEAAILVAGDGDYVPLVQPVKRLGKLVVVMFLDCPGFSEKLKRACDRAITFDEYFTHAWDTWRAQQDREAAERAAKEPGS
jgi:hypothetical protein